MEPESCPPFKSSAIEEEGAIDLLRVMLVTTLGIDPSKLQSDTRLRDVGLDSLTLMEFGFQIEKRFDIRLQYDFERQSWTLGELARLVQTAINS